MLQHVGAAYRLSQRCRHFVVLARVLAIEQPHALFYLCVPSLLRWWRNHFNESKPSSQCIDFTV